MVVIRQSESPQLAPCNRQNALACTGAHSPPTEAAGSIDADDSWVCAAVAVHQNPWRVRPAVRDLLFRRIAVKPIGSRRFSTSLPIELNSSSDTEG